jgi:hypothetical protein
MFLSSLTNVTLVMFLGSPTNVRGLCSSVTFIGSPTNVTSVMFLDSPMNKRAYVPQCHMADEHKPMFISPDGPVGLYLSSYVPRP